MPFCINCGHRLAEGAKFCAGCGSPVSDPSDHTTYSTRSLDIALDTTVKLKGPKDARSEVTIYVPQLSKSVRVNIPNCVEVGQIVKATGGGLSDAHGAKGDLLITIAGIEYYDIEMTTSVKLSGPQDSATKIFLYLPHRGKRFMLQSQTAFHKDILYG